MPDVKAIEDAVRSLQASDLAEFRRWFAEFDFTVWDGKIEADAKNGKLDGLLREAEEDYELGNHRAL